MGPLATGFCPAPLAIGSHGYIRFDVDVVDPFGGGKGHGAYIVERPPPEPKKDTTKLAALAVIAIEEYYE